VSSIGMRLFEERERLGLTQPAMADACHVTMRSQRNYEKDDRFPDAAYLACAAALGVDIHYIVTGERERPPPEVLSADERELLTLFRAAPLAVKAAAIGALQGAAGAAPGRVRAGVYVGENRGQAANKIINKS